MNFPGPDATRKEVAAFFEAHGLDRNGHTVWFEFGDWNCNDYLDEEHTPCRGWDGESERCDCGNRRVYLDENGYVRAD